MRNTGLNIIVGVLLAATLPLFLASCTEESKKNVSKKTDDMKAQWEQTKQDFKDASDAFDDTKEYYKAYKEAEEEEEREEREEMYNNTDYQEYRSVEDISSDPNLYSGDEY